MVQATPVNYNSLQFGCAPPEGAIVITVDLDFAASQIVECDASVLQAKGTFSQLQTIYVDNSLNGSAVTILLNQTFQTLTCPANKQGYFAVLMPNPPSKVTFRSAGGVVVKAQMMNFFLPTFVW